MVGLLWQWSSSLAILILLLALLSDYVHVGIPNGSGRSAATSEGWNRQSSQRHGQMTLGSVSAGWILTDVSIFLPSDGQLFPVCLVWPLYICCQLVVLTGLKGGIMAWPFPFLLLLFLNSSSGLQPMWSSLLVLNLPLSLFFTTIPTPTFSILQCFWHMLCIQIYIRVPGTVLKALGFLFNLPTACEIMTLQITCPLLWRISCSTSLDLDTGTYGQYPPSDYP